MATKVLNTKTRSFNAMKRESLALASVMIFVLTMLLLSGCANNRGGSGSAINSNLLNSSSNFGSHKVVVYLFYGEGCPHCAKERPFLQDLKQNFSGLEIKEYEVWHNQTNKAFFKKMASAYNVPSTGVPVTFIGNFSPIIGFGTADTTGAQIKNEIIQCSNVGCINPLTKLNNS